MSNEQLKHIFDNSACLTRRQMKDYVSGTMTNEESHAAEVHLNACPFCNDAIEGLFEQREGNAVEVLSELNTDFLKDHFSIQHPHIHLNSLSPAAQPAMVQGHHRKIKKSKSQPLYRNAAIAASILLCFGTLWYFEFGNRVPKNELAQENTTTQQEEGGLIAANTPAHSDIPAGDASSEPAAPHTNGPNSQMPQLLITGKLGEEAKQKNEASPEQENTMALADNADVVLVPTAPATKAIAAEPATSMVANEPKALSRSNTNAITSAAPGTANRQAFAVQAESMKKSTAESNAKELNEEEVADKREVLLADKKYNATLNAYKADLISDDKATRQKAMLMSAKSYIGLGLNDKARATLQNLIEESTGSTKREAKRLLKDIGEEEE